MSQTPKNILFYVPIFPVNSEVFIEKEIAQLATRGNMAIKVLALKKGNGVLSDILTDKVVYSQLKLTDGLRLIPVIVGRLGKIVEAYNTLANLNTPFFARVYLLGKAIGYSAIVKKINPDHIHAHFLSDASTLMLLVSIITGIPFSISAHAKDVFVYPELVREKAKLAKFIAVCNKNAWDRVCELAGDEYKAKVLLQYHGYDFDRLKNVDASTLAKPSVPLILSVGRMEEKKGHIYLIEASNELKKLNIPHKVIIIGGGYAAPQLELFRALQARIKELHLEEIVELRGNGQDQNSEVLKYMSIADIFARPSITASSGDVEGIPNTMVEASYFALPLVGANSGSIREVLLDRKTGILVAEKDVVGLTEALKTLLANKALREEYGSNAKTYVLVAFAIDANIILLEETLLTA